MVVVKVFFPTLLLLAFVTSSLAFPGFDAKDIMRLVATVDPNTCNCLPESRCNIAIPYTSVLGISCESGRQVSITKCNHNLAIYRHFGFKRWRKSV